MWRSCLMVAGSTHSSINSFHPARSRGSFFVRVFPTMYARSMCSTPSQAERKQGCSRASRYGNLPPSRCLQVPTSRRVPFCMIGRKHRQGSDMVRHKCNVILTQDGIILPSPNPPPPQKSGLGYGPGTGNFDKTPGLSESLERKGNAGNK